MCYSGAVLQKDEMVARFNTRLSLGDALLQIMELRTGAAECRLKFESGGLLGVESTSSFDMEARYKPASLWFHGVRSIDFDGSYQLNSTVVDFGASARSDSEYIEFYFDLTGGHDAERYYVKMKIVAKSFEYGPWVE